MTFLRLKDKMPAPTYEKVLQEAARVGWPFLPVPAEGVLPVSAGGEEKAQHPACEPMSEHQHWRQLRDVIQDGMRIAQGGGKLRRITAEQRKAIDVQAAETTKEAGSLPYNDALLLVSRHTGMPVDEVIHEWNFEVDWQREWGSRTQHPGGSAGSSSSSNQCQ